MELTKLIKEFVSRRENAEIVVDLTKLSTEYFSDYIRNKDRYLPRGNKDYSHSLKKIDHYIKKHKELRKIDPRDFSIELMKYLYEHRRR